MKYKVYLFILLFILLFFLLYNLYLKEVHKRTCDDIYNQTPLYNQQKIIYNLLSNQECDDIIEESEKYATIKGWTKKRHKNYPTTDNIITSTWNCYSKIEKRIKEKLYPEYSKLFKINHKLLEIQEIFIAKYDADKPNSQKSLKPHIDDSEFSFIIALNDNYKGSGTYFLKNKKKISLKKGDVVIFSGQTKHMGLPVTQGVRYIIPGFIYYGKCEQQDDSDSDDDN